MPNKIRDKKNLQKKSHAKKNPPEKNPCKIKSFIIMNVQYVYLIRGSVTQYVVMVTDNVHM